MITRSWLRGLPVSSRDPHAVICLSEGFPGQAWIADQIHAGVNYLATHWKGAWNHGLVQDLKLMRIGCAYPPDAFGGDALQLAGDGFQPDPVVLPAEPARAVDRHAGRRQRAGDRVREVRL